MTQLRLARIATYPVKSLRGIDHEAAIMEERGIAGDRRWLVVDPQGRFLTRRQFPVMAQIDVTPTGDGLRLSHRRLGTCQVARPGADAPVVTATVWRDTLPLRFAAGADAFLSTLLDRPVRLAWQFEESRRPIAPAFAAAHEHVSLADGFPLLVTTTASLAALNGRLAHPVEMDRFRPNLVIDGAEPWAEDRWRRVRIGDVVLRLARPCSRCIVVTQTPLTGAREDGNEPLDTLRALGRRTKDGIMFGQHAVPETLGPLRVGDPVEVMESGASNV
jgi:uncharacterized protein YcbX